MAAEKIFTFKGLIILTKFSLIFNFSFTGFNIYPQSAWQWIQPKPTGDFLYSVHFANNSTGFAAGSFGAIIKTTNAGEVWFIVHSNPGLDLSEVFFINSNTGFAVGKAGVILKTTDEGNTWIVKTSTTTNYLHDIVFPTTAIGYSVGLNGTILKTTDSGNNWVQLTSGTNAALFCVNFLNQNTGTAAGYNIILKTTNGGKNWINQNANIVLSSSVVGISMTDSSKIIAAGNSPGGMIYKTTNSGLNWNFVPLELPYLFGGSVDLLRSMDFLNINTGFVVTDFGTILRTINGGINWTRDSSFRPSYEKLSVMYDLNIFDSDIIHISGNGGNIFKSSNKGLNWIALTGNKNSLRGNYFINANTGYCAGEEGIIMKTQDGGISWNNFNSGTKKFLNSVFFINEFTGYIAGDSGIILQSTNPNSRWKIQSSNTFEKLNCIYFMSKDTGIAAGGDESNSHAIILRTTTAGKKWSPVFNSLNLGKLKSVYFINKNTGIITGDNGNILRSTDSGLNWFCENISAENLNSVSFADSLNGLIAGNNGVIFKTTNSGLNWISVNSSTFLNLNSVKYSNIDHAFAGGENGVIISSENGGINWTSEERISNNNIYSLNILNYNIIAFGEYGTIIRKESQNPLVEESTKRTSGNNFILSQNYPNPFNPSTIIRYELQKPVHIRLLVHNILGEDILLLVDEKKEAGAYEIKFNAHNLSSGIYFYSIFLNGVRADIKRMVLIK